MYSVTFVNGLESTVVHDDKHMRYAYRDYRLVDAVVTQARKKVDMFEFKIYPNNIGYDRMSELKTLVIVTDDDGEQVFKGRILKVTHSMDSDGIFCKQVYCEGMLGVLNDSVQIYGVWTGSSTSEILEWILNNHNRVVGHEKQILLGNCNCGNPLAETEVKTEYGQTSWEALNTLLLNDPNVSCMPDLVINEEEDSMTINLWKDHEPGQGGTIRFAYNMLEAEKEMDGTKIITRLVPVGAKYSDLSDAEDSDEETKDLQVACTSSKYHYTSCSSIKNADVTYMTLTKAATSSRTACKICRPPTIEINEDNEEEVVWAERSAEYRITVESVNDGKIYIEDEEAVEKYGTVCGYYENDDVTDPAELMKLAKSYLQSVKDMSVKYTINAVDISAFDEDFKGFHVGWGYEVKNEGVDVDEHLTLDKMTIDLNEPTESTLEFCKDVPAYVLASASKSKSKINEKNKSYDTMTERVANSSSAASAESEGKYYIPTEVHFYNNGFTETINGVVNTWVLDSTNETLTNVDSGHVIKISETLEDLST